jgi:hypothetical protein
MKILSILGRGVLLSLASLTIGVWILTMAFQLSLFNRSAVLGWLDHSGAYDHAVDAIVKLQDSGTEQQSLETSALSQAIDNTLTPAFVKQSTETAVNSIFDWLEGKSDTLAFSIPLSEKRDELQRQLTETLAPQFKNLPTCQSNFSGISLEDAECLPSSNTADQAASTAAQQYVESSDFLSKPLTEDALGQGVFAATSRLPEAFQSLSTLSWTLPIATIVFGAAYIVLSEQKLRGGRKLAGNILLSAGITTALGLVLWLGSGSSAFNKVADGQEAALINDIVRPILAQVFTGVGFWLTIFAGSVSLLCIAAWILLFAMGRKVGKAHEAAAGEWATKINEHQSAPVTEVTDQDSEPKSDRHKKITL